MSSSLPLAKAPESLGQSPGEPSSSAATSHPLLDNSYEMGGKLGRGCFASVFKAARRKDNLPVAVKVVEKNRLDSDTAHLLQNELQILQAVSEHPGIVTLLDNLETDTHMYFVMEFVDGGPLLDRIVSRGTFSENDARIMLRTVLLTLQFMSDLGCVHRDIKPENILVDNHSQTWPVKLTDFGLSAKMQPDELLYGALGTPLFVAPEILKGYGYDCSCDMWSLGVVLYIVLCGYPPFPFYDSPNKLISAIINCQYSFPAPEWDRVSSDAKDMLTRMLEVDPSKRITATQALSHPWITVAQSTRELPNSKLKTFNARRKLKATVVAVRTTFDLRNIVDPSRRVMQKVENQQELLEDVERNRALIQKMGILDESPTQDSEGAPSEDEQPKLKPSRRSLVLPVSIFDSLSANTSGSVETVRTDDRGSYNVSHSDESILSDSQVMQTRAKAMVAEVRESPVLEDSANPFLLPPAASDASPEDGRRVSLQQLDLGSLGIP